MGGLASPEKDAAGSAPSSAPGAEHRALDPRETVARMAPYFSELGITRVANVTGLDVVGIPTFLVARPNGRSLSVHQGKGATADAARASGVMEATEHDVAERATDLRRTSLVRATASALRRRGRVVDVARLPRSVRSLDDDTPTLWIPGEDVASGEAVWVPFEIVHLDLRVPLPPGSGFFPLGSNGLASGNEPLEAIVHGVCELVERDAMTLFYGESALGQDARRIDPTSVDDAPARALLAKFDAAGIEVGLWDATSDVGVPTVFGLVVDREFDPFRPLGAARGSGTHPNREVALARALCEAAQSRLTRIVGTRDDLQARELARHRAPAASVLALEQLRRADPRRAFAALPSAGSSTPRDDLRWLLERLAEREMPEVVTVDLSRRELPCAVRRAIVPGLEGVLASPSYRPGARARRSRAQEAT